MNASLLARRHAQYLSLCAVLLVQPLLTLPAGSTVACGILLLLSLALATWGAGTEPRAPSRLPALLGAGAAAGLLLLLPLPWRPGLALLVLAGLADLAPAAWTRRLAVAGRGCGSLFLLGSLLAGPARHALAMLETWPPTGWAAWLAGRIMGQDVSLSAGSLVLGTPLENQPFPLAPEWTGLLTQAVLAGLALAWAWRGAPRAGTPGSLREGARGALRLGIVLALGQLWFGLVFLGLCRLGSTLDFYEIPWQPLVWIVAGLPVLWLSSLLRDPEPVPSPEPPAAFRPASLALAALALALVLAGLLGEDEGRLKAGRLLVDDGHSDWEWVETPMTPDVFGSKTTYNFHGLGRLLSQYYDLHVTHDDLTPQALAQVDVLVLKTPTRPYAPEEIAAVHAFVRAGGGLYLISDHTNVFGMSTWLNQVVEPLGFRYNSDAVFALRSRSDQVWRAADALPHPAAAGLESYRFLTGCSIRPGWRAQVVIAGAEAGASPVCYHESNFFNAHPPRAEYRFGSLVQVASLKVGRGRVLGFSDSTTYSNFAVFWPGRLEQILAALDWLNRRNSALPWPPLSLGAGLLLLAWAARRRTLERPAWLAAALLAALVALPALQLRLAAAHPATPLRHALPAASVDAELSQATFPLLDKLDSADPLNLETFVIWLHRTGRLPVLNRGPLPPGADLHIIINPKGAPGAARQAELRAFMEKGGTLLVALRPSQYSTGLNPWLGALGLRFGNRLIQQQAATLEGQADSVWVDEALSVEGGQPIAWDRTGVPLAAGIAVGQGRLVVSGLADCFNTLHLGNYDTVPSGLSLESLRVVYRHLGLALSSGDLREESVPHAP